MLVLLCFEVKYLKVLFLIGNGFDCNLGLRTTYKDFYPYYIKQFPNDRLANNIKDNYIRWSDLELGLGEYLKEICKTDLSIFYDEKGNIELALTDYLTKEKNRISFGAGIKEEFLKKLQNFPRELSKKDYMEMTQWLNSTRESIHYSFISFNYTNIISTILDLPYKGTSLLWHVNSQLRIDDVVDKQPLYIHGSLNDRIVLGVNDITQIKNEDIAKDPQSAAFMIKQELNNQIGEMRWEDAKEQIDNSQYIIIYGMSLGDTDRNYWRYLYDWLSVKDKIHKLILCVYTTQNVKQSATEYSRQLQIQRERFILAAGIKTVDEDVLQNIIVLNNPTVFNFSHISLKDEGKEE